MGTFYQILVVITALLAVCASAPLAQPDPSPRKANLLSLKQPPRIKLTKVIKNRNKRSLEDGLKSPLNLELGLLGQDLPEWIHPEVELNTHQNGRHVVQRRANRVPLKRHVAQRSLKEVALKWDAPQKML
ncbi:hypothetical protein TCAL_03380 [Tigriopus californicus]|uniref:Uncharacterized protein n=1 Tax=Tigriopus californicus TaxID=6832 RepID=A0A553P311_TIGCA|nr:hypothetical protein TCAL_03380 [Tigriopus californicus]|eukprot:TCALIF_03380-PA protein Name:"Protein of unknown function" AED:0.00 eAED:0.00 QI:130/1/1/1/1/1/2/55/129